MIFRRKKYVGDVKKAFKNLHKKLYSKEFMNNFINGDFDILDLEVVCNHFNNMLQNIKCFDDIMSFENWCENGKIFEYDFEDVKINKKSIENRIEIMNILKNDFDFIVDEIGKDFLNF